MLHLDGADEASCCWCCRCCCCCCYYSLFLNAQRKLIIIIYAVLLNNNTKTTTTSPNIYPGPHSTCNCNIMSLSGQQAAGYSYQQRKKVVILEASPVGAYNRLLYAGHGGNTVCMWLAKFFSEWRQNHVQHYHSSELAVFLKLYSFWAVAQSFDGGNTITH